MNSHFRSYADIGLWWQAEEVITPNSNGNGNGRAPFKRVRDGQFDIKHDALKDNSFFSKVSLPHHIMVILAMFLFSISVTAIFFLLCYILLGGDFCNRD
jgi:hypothetical protein